MMTNNARNHINQIRRDKYWLDENNRLRGENPLASDLQDSIEHLSEGLYSSNAHFIFELIQNAEDNAYQVDQPSLSLKLIKTDPTSTNGASGALIFQNNEVGFSAENVIAICAVGKTTKSKIQGYIGEKGIGFKSVFRVTTTPHILSNGYRFCLPEYDKETGLGFIVPKWIDILPKGTDLNQTTIILPLDKKDFKYENIEAMLRNIEPETILFLSKLKKLTIFTDTGDNVSIIKDDTKAPLIQVLVNGTKAGISISKVYKFLVYPKTFSVPENIYHEKRIGIADREVTIAFPLNDENGSTGKIFAYLPISSNINLPFLINADFTLTSSREAIQEEQPWNQWLAKCVAELIGETLVRLKKYGHLTVEFLEKFARGLLSLDEKDFLYPIIGEVSNAFKNKKLLTADDGTFVFAQVAKLARGADLRNLLNQNQLRLLFESINTINWLTGEITQDRTPDLRTYLLKELNIEEVTPESFSRKITQSFLEIQTDDWFIKFYSYLSGQEALWRSPRWQGDAGGVLREKPILRLQNDELVSFQSESTTPNAFLPPPEETDFPVIKRAIVENERSMDFLKRLGLSEPDIFDDIVKKVLPKYEALEASSISEREHISDVKRILRALRSDSESGKKKVIQATQNTPFLKSVNQNGSIKFKKPKVIYLPTQELKIYFLGATDVWFLNENEGEEEWREVGVEDKPRFIKSMVDFSPDEKRRFSGRNSEKNDYDLDGVSNFLSRVSKDKEEFSRYSLVLWNFLLQHLEEKSHYQFYEGEYKWHYRTTKRAAFDATWKKQLCLTVWLPSVHDNLPHSPSELSINDLPEIFNHDDKLAEILGMKKDVVALLAEKAGLQIMDIELMMQHPEEFQQWKAKIAAKKEKPIFPTKSAPNPDRRAEQIIDQIKDSSEKKYEPRTRSIRITEATEYTRIRLKEYYINNKGQMVCQICKEEMPFKKRNGEYYYEAVEAFSKDYFNKEHEAQFLALCPLCAAMYKEFVKLDKNAMKDLCTDLKNSESKEFKVSLKLGEWETSLQFVQSHWLDIRTILQEMG